MTLYHAVLRDETGCEFGTTCESMSYDDAWDMISEAYPESQIVQLESPEDTEEREMETYARACAIWDDGEDGRYDRWDY